MTESTVQKLAAECGFELAGVAPVTPVQDAEAFLHWVEKGYAGRMAYLTDYRAQRRTDPHHLLPAAESMICVGKVYNDGLAEGPISRYARFDDYHDVLRAGLERLRQSLECAYGPFEYKICVDTAPLLERSYARLAGLGWIGKNTCLINQQLGSWVFLGEMLTSLRIPPGTPAPDRCGTCTRCIDACPTAAIAEGGLRTEIDSTRCISYLTIECKGTVPDDMRPAVGEHVFGCDICQDVCPWNRHAPAVPFAAPRDAAFADIATWASMTPEEFATAFRGTPVYRSRYSGFLRNVAIAMGNSRQECYRPLIEKLAESDDELVREHAKWALERL